MTDQASWSAYGTTSNCTETVTSVWYPYPDYQPIWTQPNYSYVYYTYPPFDYELLAEKIVEKLKGKESRSIEEVRKEINKLLDEIAQKEKKS